MPTPTPPPPPTEVAAPLTGEAVPIAQAEGPSLAVKVDNHPAARPQEGLARADLVFEELVEGGMTRYVAVWHSDVPAQVGPVRSIRPMDPDIVAPLGGIIAYSGGRPPFVAMMQSTQVHNAIHGGTDDRFMHRTRDRRAPHNVLLDAPQIRENYAQLAAPPAQFSYTPQGAAPAAGVPAAGIDADFSRDSTRQWRWDAGSGTYQRSQHGTADADASGAAITATNVVVLRVQIDWAYGDVPRTVMVGSGEAWVSTGGSVVAATWHKDAQASRIVLVDAAGQEVALAPGNTWIELVPTSGAVRIVE